MENDLIVGLGGHIDHGKTSLIKALNGFDGDERLEEKQRGITLDISFSNLYLPPDLDNTIGRNISFVDVPGHEKLIKNMIAGAFGIDVFLLVIACDDGIMPQSVEHLQIADILGIQQAICVISKADLMPNLTSFEDLKQRILDMFSKLKNTKLYAILDFSIHQRQTHQKLLEFLKKIPKPQKKDSLFFRYYIDRAFSIAGAGSVVTGSVLSGSVQKDEKVYICDLDTEVSIKSIKNHNTYVESATPSHRIAFNLKGVNVSSLKRGFLISKKGYIRGFDTLDVVIYPLKDTPNLHNLEVQFFIGAKKCNAKIYLLDLTLQNKEVPYLLATLKTHERIFSVFGEKFILRNTDRTIAGGEILNPIADPIKKKQKSSYLNFLFKKDFQNAFLLCCKIHKRGFGLISSMQRFDLAHKEAIKIASTLGELFLDEKNLVIYHPQTFKTIRQDILDIFLKNKNALLSASSLGLKIKWASLEFIQKALDDLKQANLICKKEGLYLSKENKVKNINDYLQENIFEVIHAQGFTPLAPYNIYDELNIDRKIGNSALKALSAAQKVIRLEHNLFVATDILNQIHKNMRKIIEEKGYIDIVLFKEKYAFSRKYLIAYLDYLDRFDDIKNQDGKRILKYQGKQ
ncbi:selenocysteine-specific translation elongation factor [Helicobacter sp. 11S03491-1]|uniref:selenocysteine-specific translation elongation factor n=1 Tax=Helicobacter sp. 11S03491-1 TaxID=1476196 RepID=UPI000BA7B441|nr:selenocysteine-specific translation elongation factor [Helicobacter sp. 11S03491-1]PAF43746.1 selenocysteine-specific translation elongation factor [Helicobacter sp. 11S03491-1]